MELKDDGEDSGWSRKSLETRHQEDEIEERQAKAFLHGDQSKFGWFGGVLGTRSTRIQYWGHMLSGVKGQIVPGDSLQPCLDTPK